VIQIDSPQNIFITGVDRGAVIAVGIAALALVNDVFLAPNIHKNLSGKLAAVHQRVRAFAIAILQWPLSGWSPRSLLQDCSPSAQIEVKRGIMPSAGATIRMTERAGLGNALRYL
jgi:hypothetical protein